MKMYRFSVKIVSILVFVCGFSQTAQANLCKDAFAMASQSAVEKAVRFIGQKSRHFKAYLRSYRPSFAPYIRHSHQKYANLTELVKDLKSGKLDPKDLKGDIIPIPKELGLRETLTEGRMVHLRSNLRKPKAVQLVTGGLFNGTERVLSRTAFISGLLSQGVDVIYVEVSQGYTAAREILNNKGVSPTKISHKEQQKLLAFYILKAIEMYKLPISIPKTLVGHSYGGWLVNRFASNPEFNGQARLENPYLKELARDLHQKGLVNENPMKNLFTTLIPMDAGLSSLHLGHPILAKFLEMTGVTYFSGTNVDISLANFMRTTLVKAHQGLRGDTHGMDNAIALFLGIRSENMFNAPARIPDNINIFNIVSGRSELIPSSFHRHYSESLELTSKGSQHRSTLIIKDAPHDLLPIPGVGSLLGKLSVGEFKVKSFVSLIQLHRGRISSEKLDEFPGDPRSDMAQIIVDFQNGALNAYLNTLEESSKPIIFWYDMLPRAWQNSEAQHK